MKSKKILCQILWALASVMVMGLIFYFSAQDSTISSAQSGWLISAFFFWLPKEYASLIVRKAAHFTIYFILGFCMLHAFNPGQAKIRPAQFVIALLLCFVYALSDEFHQSFVGGRAARFTDCLIDGSGAACAMLLISLFRAAHGQKKENPAQ